MERTEEAAIGGDGQEEVSARAREALEEGQEALRGILARVERFVRARPGTALIAALGAGFIVGRLVRRR